MSASTTTLPFVARERWFRKAEAPAGVRPAGPEGDAEAQRVSAAVGRGEEAAFRELYDRYHGRVFRLALVLGRGDETLAQEVAQATMLTAAAKLKAVDSEAHLWNWLARVARQKMAKARRQEADGLVVSLELLPETTGGPAEATALERKLDLALGALDADERRIVERFYYEGFSQKQMAEELQTTVKAVAGRLERVRAKLRVLIKRKGDDER